MARKKLLFKLDENLEIVIKELPLRELIENKKILTEVAKEFSVEKLLEALKLIMPSCVEGLQYNALLDLTPSEIKDIWTKFEEVNSTFLDNVGYKEAKALLQGLLDKEIKRIVSEIQKEIQKEALKSEEDQATPLSTSPISAPA